MGRFLIAAGFSTMSTNKPAPACQAIWQWNGQVPGLLRSFVSMCSDEHYRIQRLYARARFEQQVSVPVDASWQLGKILQPDKGS